MSRFSRLPRLIQFLALLAFWVGLIQPAVAAKTHDGEYPYEVVATVGMVADIVRQVAGDRAQVRQLMNAGTDPHTYSPTRDDLAALMKADVIFYSGLLLEGRMTDVFAKLSHSRPVYAVTAMIDESYLYEDPESGHHDPHVWMDVSGWMRAVEAVRGALTEYDPAGAAIYEANAAEYLAKLKALDEYARTAVASIPGQGRVLVTAHDAFRYMARAYGLEVHGIQGLSTESEAGLQDINRLVDMLVGRRIGAVFVESSVSEKNVRALVEGSRSRGHDLRIGGELFSDAMGPDGTYEGTYIGMIDHNVTTIVRALGGTAPEKGLNGRLGAGTRGH